ncbi:MAG: PEP-CTERM sorting domain-containing protein, partial [Thermoguttaceae bacterium]
MILTGSSTARATMPFLGYSANGTVVFDNSGGVSGLGGLISGRGNEGGWTYGSSIVVKDYGEINASSGWVGMVNYFGALTFSSSTYPNAIAKLKVTGGTDVDDTVSSTSATFNTPPALEVVNIAQIVGSVTAPSGTAITKTGTGTLTLSGDSSATWGGAAGGVLVQAGGVVSGAANGLGTTGGTVVSGGAALYSNIADGLNGATITLSGTTSATGKLYSGTTNRASNYSRGVVNAFRGATIIFDNAGGVCGLGGYLEGYVEDYGTTGVTNDTVNKKLTLTFNGNSGNSTPLTSSLVSISAGSPAVTGPAGATTIAGLTLGNGTTTPTLTLQTGGNLTVTGAATVNAGATLTAANAGLIVPTLALSGGTATLNHAANSITTATVASGSGLSLLSGTIGTLNASGGTSSLSGSSVTTLNANGGITTVGSTALVSTATVAGGTFTLSGGTVTRTGDVTTGTGLVTVANGTLNLAGNATTATVTGGGITTTGGAITNFNHNTGASTSTIGAGTTVTTTTINAGTVNFNSTQANGSLSLPTGSTGIVNFGSTGGGATVGTANFSAGTGTANASYAQPLTITNQLQLPAGVTATLTGGSSFTASGSNLASTVNTLALSGGTLSFSVNSVQAFTSSGTLTVPAGGETVKLLLVVGGGGGGGSLGGGGGAVVWIPSGALAAGTYTVNVGGSGSAGTGSGGNGGSGGKTYLTLGGSTIVSAGGGGGYYSAHGGQNGGSGGGSGAVESSTSGATGGGGYIASGGHSAYTTDSSLGSFSGTIYGNAGGDVTGTRVNAQKTNARGGGGADAAATSAGASDSATAGTGGDGKQITDSSLGSYNNFYWGGGGGGAAYDFTENVSPVGGTGGKGGGGGGGAGTQSCPSPTGGLGDKTYGFTATAGNGGTATNNGAGSIGGAGGTNTGGGGGASFTGGAGGAGGSGFVLVVLPGALNFPNTTIAATANSPTLDLGGVIDATLGGLSLTGGTLTVQDANSLTLTGSGSSGFAISATGSGAMAIAGTTPIQNVAGTVNVASGATLTIGALLQNGSGSTINNNSLVETGGGTVILTNTGNAYYGGGTTISAGILQIGDGSTTNGSLPNIAMASGASVTDNDRLVFANPTYLQYAGTITGTGSLSKTGTGSILTIGASGSVELGDSTLNGNAIPLGTSGSAGTLAPQGVAADGVHAVPEPGTLALLAAAAACGFAIRRKKGLGIRDWGFGDLGIWGFGENRQIRSTKLQTNPKSQIQNPKSNTLPWQADRGRASQETL